jgi:5-methylcytosine-specific restriction endonuclease McrA
MDSRGELRTWKVQREDPRWQKKKAEICERDNWTCKMCGDTDSQLSVHHSFYMPRRAIWDYPNKSLHCLCWSCHQKAQSTKEALDELIGCLQLSSIERLERAVRAFMEQSK